MHYSLGEYVLQRNYMMTIKMLKAAVAVLILSVGGFANAGLIEGDLYSDHSGIQWEYVGSFDLVNGPDWNGSTPYNGIDAAILNFGTLSVGQFALSSNKMADYIDIADFEVNHMAWYDSYAGRSGIFEFSESVVANAAGGSTFDAVGDISAFVSDSGNVGENYNHVFKSASVPEPSTLAIFALGIIGLASRRFKKQS